MTHPILHCNIKQTNQTLSPTVAVTRPDTPSPTPAPITPFPTEPEPTTLPPVAPKPEPTTKMPYMSVNYSTYVLLFVVLYHVCLR